MPSITQTFTSTENQHLRSQGGSWAKTKEGTGTSLTVESGLQAWAYVTDGRESFISFNTSSLPDAAVITSAVIKLNITSIYKPAAFHFWGIQGFIWPWRTSLSSADWGKGSILVGANAYFTEFESNLNIGVNSITIPALRYPDINRAGYTEMLITATDIGTNAEESPPDQTGIVFATGAELDVSYRTTPQMTVMFGANF